MTTQAAFDIAIEFIKREEGLSLDAYQDSAGVWTIGYGQTGPGITKGTVWSGHQAEERLKESVRKYADGVDEMITLPMTDNQHAALTSLAYNIGLSAFKHSQVRKYLNAGKVRDAAEAITLWNKITDPLTKKKVISKGLNNRRQREMLLFLRKAPSMPCPLAP